MEKYNLIKDAIINNNTELVEESLTDFNINIKDEDNNTLLHHACENDKHDSIKLLLNNGANPNLKENSFGLTPLHWATEYGDMDMVKLLIDNGADPNIPDDNGEKPISNDEVKELYLEYKTVQGKLLSSEQRLAISKNKDIDNDLLSGIGQLIKSGNTEQQLELIDRFIKQSGEKQRENILSIYRDRLSKKDLPEKERIKINTQLMKYLARTGSKKYNKKSNENNKSKSNKKNKSKSKSNKNNKSKSNKNIKPKSKKKSNKNNKSKSNKNNKFKKNKNNKKKSKKKRKKI